MGASKNGHRFIAEPDGQRQWRGCLPRHCLPVNQIASIVKLCDSGERKVVDGQPGVVSHITGYGLPCPWSLAARAVDRTPPLAPGIHPRRPAILHTFAGIAVNG